MLYANVNLHFLLISLTLTDKIRTTKKGCDQKTPGNLQVITNYFHLLNEFALAIVGVFELMEQIEIDTSFIKDF